MPEKEVKQHFYNRGRKQFYRPSYTPELVSMLEAMNRRSSIKYTFATMGECCVEEELIYHLIISLST